MQLHGSFLLSPMAELPLIVVSVRCIIQHSDTLCPWSLQYPNKMLNPISIGYGHTGKIDRLIFRWDIRIFSEEDNGLAFTLHNLGAGLLFHFVIRVGAFISFRLFHLFQVLRIIVPIPLYLAFGAFYRTKVGLRTALHINDSGVALV